MSNHVPATAFVPHDHQACAARALDGAEARVAAGGGRLTPVRRRTLEILLESHRAMGAYDILQRLAGAGFGGFLIAVDATDSATTPWPLVAARLVSVAIAVALVLRSGGSPVPRRSDGTMGAIIAAGMFDTTANLTFLMAVNRGQLSLTAAISALYPAMTVLLARTVLHERMVRNQIIGMAVAVVAVACMVVG